MNYKELELLHSFLLEVGKIGTTFQFDYAVARNIDKIESIFKPMHKALVVEKANDYRKKIAEINEKYCKKTEDGGIETTLIDTPTGKISQYVIADENKAVRLKELDLLKTKYAQAIKEEKAKIDAYNKEIQQECIEFKPFKVTEECLKEAKEVAGEKLTANMIAGLMPLIKKEEQ